MRLTTIFRTTKYALVLRFFPNSNKHASHSYGNIFPTHIIIKTLRHAKEPPKQLYFVCSWYCFCTMMKDKKRVKRRSGRRFLSFSLRKVVYHHLRSLITLLITLQISPMIAKRKILFMVDSKSECKEQNRKKIIWGMRVHLNLDRSLLRKVINQKAISTELHATDCAYNNQIEIANWTCK